jgi:hypothetical protein
MVVACHLAMQRNMLDHDGARRGRRPVWGKMTPEPDALRQAERPRTNQRPVRATSPNMSAFVIRA